MKSNDQKTYSITLSKSEYELLRPYLMDLKVIYEPSQMYDNVYLSMRLDSIQYQKIESFISKI